MSDCEIAPDREIPRSVETFFAACRAGDIDELRRHIAEGFDPRTATLDDQYLLHVAAEACLCDVIDFLVVSTGMDVGARDDAEMTALHWATFSNGLPATMTLLRHGAAVDAVDADFRTPLHEAARHCNRPLVRELIQRGAPINAVDTEGISVLGSACYNGNIVAVEELLAAGCEPRAMPESRSNLVIAAGCGHLQLMRMLLRDGKVDVDERDPNSKTATLTACVSGNASIVEFAVQQGGSVALRDNRGRNSAIIAAEYGHLDAAAVLCDRIVAESLRNCKCGARNGLTILQCEDDASRPAMIELMMQAEETVFAGCLAV